MDRAATVCCSLTPWPRGRTESEIELDLLREEKSVENEIVIHGANEGEHFYAGQIVCVSIHLSLSARHWQYCEVTDRVQKDL